MGIPLKIGIMSLAHVHAASYIQTLRHIADIEIRISDPDAPAAAEPFTRGRDFADAHDISYANNYAELLRWEPDAVIITSENSEHRRLVEMAANAHAHILCEKPLATTWSDAIAIRDAVEHAGVHFMMAYPVRFSPSFSELWNAHQRGALGTIVSIRGENNGMLPRERDWFTDPARAGGGALFDHVVHLADLLDSLMGANAVTVTAITNQILHAKRARAETAGLVSICYDNGVIAAIDCSWSQPDTAARWGGVWLHVLGTQGTVDVDFFGAGVRGIDAETGRTLDFAFGADLDGVLVEEFLTMIRDDVPRQPDLAVGLRTLAPVLAAQQSARTGQTVSLSELGLDLTKEAPRSLQL
jgi:1,5-anhydro-D-fructose reductase (1,5-anhydro-D-mannitol-forming)